MVFSQKSAEKFKEFYGKLIKFADKQRRRKEFGGIIIIRMRERRKLRYKYENPNKKSK